MENDALPNIKLFSKALIDLFKDFTNCIVLSNDRL
jgi:hypothetical protein